ncbi:MAG: hypothetical protein U0794_11325 [Isosphaeraceae bacterium]
MARAGGRQGRKELIRAFLGRRLEYALCDPKVLDDLRAESRVDPANQLVTPDVVRMIEQLRQTWREQITQGEFFSTDDVILVPALFASVLVNVNDTSPESSPCWPADGGSWPFKQLQLAELRAGEDDGEKLASTRIRAIEPLPLLYAGLMFDLQLRRYEMHWFAYDWRKNLEEAARSLATLIRERAVRRYRPLHVLAHAEGSLVARRALQLIGSSMARRLVDSLVLLAPTTAGSFDSVFALGGNWDRVEAFRRLGLSMRGKPLDVVQSWSSLYQTLPCVLDPQGPNQDEPADPAHAEPTPTRIRGQAPEATASVLSWLTRRSHGRVGTLEFWKGGVDTDRLKRFYGWPATIDCSFFNDRTTIILGDAPAGLTPAGAEFRDGKVVEHARGASAGDGVVPDALAVIPNVNRVYRCAGSGHLLLPTRLATISAVREIVSGGTPRIVTRSKSDPTGKGVATPAASPPPPPSNGKDGRKDCPLLVEPEDPQFWRVPRPSPPISTRATAGEPEAQEGKTRLIRMADLDHESSPPQARRLRVFSFDPLLATDLDALGTETIVLQLPWDFSDGDSLKPGPVGEYVEVVDYDPSNRCFYPPVDLNHPHLLAQDGLQVSEGDPRFHQQMVYAVAMSTINQFENALGRVALWSPNLQRDDHGEVIPTDDEYVQRLRIYPHAFRQANAYYSPEKKALMFGYFPAEGADIGRNLPGGMVFSCLSFDVVAHETTHALLDGLHRYMLEPSNSDVFAFHEAFADIVALFQHFSQPEVLRSQLARARGDFRKQNLLGGLAVQLGEALGKHGALRSYIGEYNVETGQWGPKDPDPQALQRESEPHGRGAILVAALFRAFTNIYENRVRDLRRIATGGTGELPDGDLHPDLVNRLADEAAKSARHMLTMCIRALDYIPPVDLTFGEYLRALITADFDLVRDDDRRYRVSVLSAFRDWGIYPGDVRSLSVDNLLWQGPPIDTLPDLREFFRNAKLDGWRLRSERRDAYLQMRQYSGRFNRWLASLAADWVKLHQGVSVDWDWSLGLARGLVDVNGKEYPRTLLRSGVQDLPIFEVHSLRTAKRIGPDGQERTCAVVELVQRRLGYFDHEMQKKVDEGAYLDGRYLHREDLQRLNNEGKDGYPPPPDFFFRGGATLIIDPENGEVRYAIRKSILSDRRLERERSYRTGAIGDAAGGIYLSDPRRGRANPFAFLHGIR